MVNAIRSLFVLLPAFGLAAACANVSNNMPDEMVELCPKSGDTPAFAMLVEGVTDATSGACGHIVYVQQNVQYLVSPDYETTEAIGGDRVGKFSDTGHLLAWKSGESFQLRDLRDDQAVIESGVSEFGFVPSTDPDRGAWLWVCKDGTLGRLDIELGYTELDRQANCEQASVRAATAAPIVVYGATEDRLRAVDLDSQRVTTLDVEHRREYAGDGSRIDDFEVAARGELVIHHQRRLEFPDDSDTDQEIHEGSSTLATSDGRVLHTTSKYLGLLESPGGEHVAVRTGDFGWDLRDGELHPLPSGLVLRTWLTNGQLVVHDGQGLSRLEPVAGALEPWIPGANAISLPAVDRTGDAIAVRVDTENCINNPNNGECTLTVSELHRATIDAPPVSLAQFSYGVDELALADNGTLFAEFGLITDLENEVVRRGAFVLGPDGTVLGQWTGEAGDVRVRQLHNTGTQFVAAIEQTSGISVVAIDAESGIASTLIPDATFDLDMRVDEERALVHDDSRHELWAGQLP